MIWTLLLKIHLAADVVGINPALLASVCYTETRIRNVVVPHDGGSPSYGMCQVKLATARQFFPKISATSLMDPYQNALAAASYLKWQLNRYKNDYKKAISAFNAGRYITGNKKYVDKVLHSKFNIFKAKGKGISYYASNVNKEWKKVLATTSSLAFL